MNQQVKIRTEKQIRFARIALLKVEKRLAMSYAIVDYDIDREYFLREEILQAERLAEKLDKKLRRIEKEYFKSDTHIKSNLSL